jgi:hypothetical protein
MNSGLRSSVAVVDPGDYQLWVAYRARYRRVRRVTALVPWLLILAADVGMFPFVVVHYEALLDVWHCVVVLHCLSLAILPIIATFVARVLVRGEASVPEGRWILSPQVSLWGLLPSILYGVPVLESGNWVLFVSPSRRSSSMFGGSGAASESLRGLRSWSASRRTIGPIPLGCSAEQATIEST